MALRYESIPFSLPFSKKELTSKIRSKKEELGITNTPMSFNGKQLKATMIYLDAFDGLTQKKLLKSKKCLICLLYLSTQACNYKYDWCLPCL